MMQLLAIKYNIQEFQVNIRLVLNLLVKEQYYLLVVLKSFTAPCFAKSNKPPCSKPPFPSKQYEINKPPPRGRNTGFTACNFYKRLLNVSLFSNRQSMF